ncbi:MotA/TolQ/ExbB proton channel family protein [Glaciecola sp. MF2-115]|uniref:MotA/TolQ/ExbB proton channel family protein n=1 Tax=Glaciecola sp. MF2-115 TaxID=3384827 RepID=UPI0039A1ECCD
MFHATPQLYRNFLHWLLIVGLVAFFLFVLFDLGVIAYIVATDSTRISQLIIVLFVLCSIFIGYRNWIIAQEFKVSYWIIDARKKTKADSKTGDHLLVPTTKHSATFNYLTYLLKNKPDKDIAQLGELYAEALSGPHKIGWFVSGVLIKLGLLGTVIGFVIMLNTVSDLDQLDISGVKQLMQQMTQGMGVAMFTTMTGLICSMLLSLQCLMLERSTDNLVSITVSLGQKLYLVEPRADANSEGL